MKVVYLGLLQNILGLKEEEISSWSGSTVGELLGSLAEKHGEPFRFVMNRDGTLKPLAKVFINDKDIDELQRHDTRLDDKAEVCVFINVEAPAGG